MKKSAKKDAKKVVAYIRVSTKRQGKSGLGLEAQRRAISFFLKEGHMQLIKEFTEVESGKKFNRPVLEKAIQYCKEWEAELVIATLDRLSRKVLFIALLIESSIRFTAVDNPNADTYTTFINAARAQDESERISKRTKQALQAAKIRGVKLGSFSKILSKRNRAASKNFALKVRPIIFSLQKKGIDTIQSITNELNRLKVKTYRQGCRWHVSTVHGVMRKAGLL
mgnify:CR=1 FL=1